MKTFKRLFSYMKSQAASYLGRTLLSMLATAATIYAPFIAGQLIDELSQRWAKGQSIEFSFLSQKFGQILFFTVISAFLGYLAYLLLTRAANAVSKTLRDEVHAHIQELPIAYFDDKPAGKISARIVNDTELLRTNFYVSFSNQALIYLLMILATYIALFVVNTTVAVCLLLLLPLFIFWQILYIRIAAPINASWRESISDLNNQTAEIVQGVSIVQLFHQQETMQKHFEKTNQKWLATRLKSTKLDTLLAWDFSTFIKNLVMFLLLTWVGRRYINGILGFSAGTIYLLIDCISRLFDPIVNLVHILSALQQALAAARRVFELLDAPKETDAAAFLVLSHGDIAFEHVSFGYDETTVLHDISFAVNQGQTVGLVGATGSGKSSIINLLFRLYDPQQGKISIDQQSITEFSRQSVRQKMGIVLQEPYLFSGRILSNITMNDDDISEQKATDAL